MDDITVKKAEEIMRMSLEKIPTKIKHSLDVTHFAILVAKEIEKNNSNIKIDYKLLEISCLLHDIGRARTDWLMHIFESAKMLREMNLEKIAEVVEKHGPAFEIAKKYQIKGDFLPKTNEERILVFSDSHFAKKGYVEPNERMKLAQEKIIEKYPEISEEIKNHTIRRMKLIGEMEELFDKKIVLKKLAIKN